MGIESADFISQLDVTNPKGTDKYGTADDHARLAKKAFWQSFRNIDSEVSASAGELNATVGLSGTVLSAISNLEATLEASLLDVGSTATAASQWGSSLKYVQSATPTVANNGFWFRTDE